MNGIRVHERPKNELIDAARDYLTTYEKQSLAKTLQSGRDAHHVDWRDIYQANHDLAHDLVHNPKPVLGAFREALDEVPLPDGARQLADLDVRVHGVDSPQTTVSELRCKENRGNYMGVRGQVSLATQVTPKLMSAVFNCERCSAPDSNFEVGPIPQSGEDIQTPGECPGCERQGPFTLIEERCEWLDHQIIELSDPPGENPGNSGNVVPVHLYGDAAGEVNPGDRIRVNGIVDTDYVRLQNQSSESRRREWLVHGHAIDEEETAFEDVEPERVDEIQSIAAREDVRERFVASYAPDILTGETGDKHKLALLLALFGGYSENDRDDINVFLIGAPGTGKSRYLERAKELAPKAVEASGKGATAAGLTATATKSETTGKWMLDAGALVLASGGVACVDEFDKMPDKVRKSMHEAMENQRVPINKAGINTTLTTETTVLAAANPKEGSFNRFDALNEQVDLGSPLLSRFDLIFGVSDVVDAERDEAIARHQHERLDGSENDEWVLEDELITEYIAYARQNIHPTYESAEPREELVDYYIQKREESEGEDEAVTPVTPRMNDALRRLAQASARMHLREEITMQDAEIAKELMDLTLGDTALEPDGSLNGARAEGRNETQASKMERLEDGLRNQDGPVTAEYIAGSLGLDEGWVREKLEGMYADGRVMQPSNGEYRWV